jgi:hypothetical protein
MAHPIVEYLKNPLLELILSHSILGGVTGAAARSDVSVHVACVRIYSVDAAPLGRQRPSAVEARKDYQRAKLIERNCYF